MPHFTYAGHKFTIMVTHKSSLEDSNLRSSPCKSVAVAAVLRDVKSNFLAVFPLSSSVDGFTFIAPTTSVIGHPARVAYRLATKCLNVTRQMRKGHIIQAEEKFNRTARILPRFL